MTTNLVTTRACVFPYVHMNRIQSAMRNVYSLFKLSVFFSSYLLPNFRSTAAKRYEVVRATEPAMLQLRVPQVEQKATTWAPRGPRDSWSRKENGFSVHFKPAGQSVPRRLARVRSAFSLT